jgi:hypothetical protein
VIGADSIITILQTGVFSVGLWLSVWHLDRRLIRLETAIGLRNQAEE